MAGGRVYSKTMSAEGASGAADLGGSIVTGCNGNPLAVLARQLGIRAHTIVADDVNVPLYWEDGGQLDETLDAKVSFMVQNIACFQRTRHGIQCAAVRGGRRQAGRCARRKSGLFLLTYRQ